MPSSNGEMVQLGGFEPPTSGSTDRRSNHLSYSCTDLGRHKAQASIVSLRPASGWKLGASPALGKGATNWALQIGRRQSRRDTKKPRPTGPGLTFQTKLLLA